MYRKSVDQYGEPIWLPRDVRCIIYSFHRELVRRERELKAKFAPVLKDVLVLGQCPRSVLQHVKNCAMDRDVQSFPANKLVYFRALYTWYPDVREWAMTSSPETIFDNMRDYSGEGIIRAYRNEATEIYRQWWKEPSLRLNLWEEIYAISRGIFNVLRNNKGYYRIKN